MTKNLNNLFENSTGDGPKIVSGPLNLNIFPLVQNNQKI